MGCWGRSHCRLAPVTRPWVAPASPVGSARAKQGILYNCPFQGQLQGSRLSRHSRGGKAPLQNKMFCASARRGEIPPPLGLPSPFRAGEPAPRAVRAGRLTPLGAAPPRYHSRHDRRKDQAERVASLRHAAAMMYGNHRGHGPLIARYYLRQHTIMCNMYI